MLVKHPEQSGNFEQHLRKVTCLHFSLAATITLGRDFERHGLFKFPMGKWEIHVIAE